MTADRTTSLTIGGWAVFAAAIVGNSAPGLAPVLVALMVTGSILAMFGLAGSGPSLPVAFGRILVSASAGLSAELLITLLPIPGAVGVVGSCIVMTVAFLACGRTGGSPVARVAMIALVVIQTLAFVMLTRRTHDHIDVIVFLEQGSERLLHGLNPYLPGYPDIYPPHLSAQLYGPGVAGPDGTLTYGTPYPPVSVVMAAIGHLFGDARYSAIVMGLGVPLLLQRMGGRQARTPAVLLASVPGLALMVVNGWTEVLIAGLFGLFALAATRGHWVAAATLLGLAFASKQYFVVALPCLWLLRPWASRRTLLAMVLPALAVTVPFILWSPQAFWRSIVEFQLVQPFRPDSVSLLTWTVISTGWPPPAVFAVLPLTAGVVVAVLCARRFSPGVAPFLVGTAISLLATTVLSKQAFFNYFFLVGSLLVLAAWCVERRRLDRSGPPPAKEGADSASSCAAQRAP